jgi:hypothetical protein
MKNSSTDFNFLFSHTPFVLKYLWAFFLVMGLINSFLSWRSLLKDIEKNEVLKAKYRHLFIQYVIWTNIPWVMMGAGILLGGTRSVLDYLQPSSGNFAVLTWWGLFMVMNFVLAIWIFFAGGAETLEKYPGLPTFLSGSAAKIKVVISIGLIFINILAVLIYCFNPWAHDGQAYSARIFLDFPFFFFFFCVVFWLLGGWLIAQFGGWVTLACFYGTNRKYEGSQLEWRSAKINWVHYHTCLNLGANHRGFYISITHHFMMNHKTLFIPWSDIQITKSEMLWGPTVILRFEKTPKVLFEIHEKTVLLLKDMAQTPEAFKGLMG